MLKFVPEVVTANSLPVQVKGVLDKEEVLFAKTQSYLYGAHVVVGTPDCLAELSQQPNAQPVMAHVKAVAVDEVDACFEVGLQPSEQASCPRTWGLSLVPFPTVLPAKKHSMSS